MNSVRSGSNSSSGEDWIGMFILKMVQESWPGTVGKMDNRVRRNGFQRHLGRGKGRTFTAGEQEVWSKLEQDLGLLFS